jgi:hypothetical protein
VIGDISTNNSHKSLIRHNVPTYTPDNLDDIAAWIDGPGDYTTANISVRLPPKHDNPVTPRDFQDNECHDAIKKSMMHKCAVAENGCKKCASSPCKRGFDSKPIQDRTTFDGKGKPVYKRTKDDALVVSHNMAMLLDWGGGHLNVEYSGNAKSVMYLYNYLFKGNVVFA